jgi:secernin
MCDTVAIPARSAAGKIALFAKNSDRPRNEAQIVELLSRADHPSDAMVACTYITIPQVRQTNAALICRPFWIWGAEMGANEHGVMIGNEAVHARIPPPTGKALIGMDLLRLALERADSAARAVEVIIALLEEHGQGGDCGHLLPIFYQNAFLIVDAKDTFVLETMGREWLIERASGVRTISNRYSIDRADRMSEGLRAWLRETAGYPESPAALSELIADPAREHIGSARARRARSASLLNAREGQLSVADVMRTLRDHSNAPGICEPSHLRWTAECVARRTICMHAGAENQGGHTAGTLVSEVRPEGAVHWVTATAIPCMSIFKPVLLNVPLPPHGPAPTDRFDAKALWWRHEQLNRMAALGDFDKVLADISAERDALESEFRHRVYAALSAADRADCAQVVAACWQEAIETEARWHARVKSEAAPHDEAYVAEWRKLNQLAGIRW